MTTPSSNVLLRGPPGCGKKFLAKSLAKNLRYNFKSVMGPTLKNMDQSENKHAVQQCIIRALNSAPCILFINKFDSLGRKKVASNEVCDYC